MGIKITVNYVISDNPTASKLRTMYCMETCPTCKQGRNPLIETNFNAVLDSLVQEAFNAGRNFEKQHPNLKD